jgi:hypothetical protein
MTFCSAISPQPSVSPKELSAKTHGYLDEPTIRFAPQRRLQLLPQGVVIIARMTLVEVTYELQSPLGSEQLRALAQFANTYGLRRFRVDEHLNRLSFEYDASRLTESEVAHVLRMARIPVQRRA